jgi:hypothetical protein
MSDNENTVETTDTERDPAVEAIFDQLTAVSQSLAALSRQSGQSKAVTRRVVAQLVEDGHAVRDDEGVRLAEVPEPQATPASRERSDLVRAVRLGTDVTYGRRSVAETRNLEILQMLQDAGEAFDRDEALTPGVAVGTVAERLGITSGAARHAIWRLQGKPIHGKPTASYAPLAVRISRSTFALVKYANVIDTSSQNEESGSDDTDDDATETTTHREPAGDLVGIDG